MILSQLELLLSETYTLCAYKYKKSVLEDTSEGYSTAISSAYDHTTLSTALTIISVPGMSPETKTRT